MIRAAKAKVMGAPTPMAYLALGIASLGWSWENMIAAHGVAQWVGAAIASVLLIVLAFKFLWHGHLLRQDLAHPVVGSVVPTFAMATMVVSASLGHFYPVAGDALWLFAVGLHILFLVSFCITAPKRLSCTTWCQAGLCHLSALSSLTFLSRAILR